MLPVACPTKLAPQSVRARYHKHLRLAPIGLASTWALPLYCLLGRGRAASVRSSTAEPVQWGGVELSPTDEFKNQELIHQSLFHRFYYSGQLNTEWSSVEGDLWTLSQLAVASMPAVAFGAANGFYHFFFFRESKDGAELRTDTMLRALQLFHVSLVFAGCTNPDTEPRDFLLGTCLAKFAFIQLLSSELGAAYSAAHALTPAAQLFSAAAESFQMMVSLPCMTGFHWASPNHMAFNHELYPNYYGPIWPKEQLALADFLEQHYAEFRADLDAILSHSGLFDHLRELERNAEGLSVWPPGQRKHIELADLREEEAWKAQLCQFAGTTCSLLQQRPEVAECPRAAVMLARLGPGAWLKPHFGNSRRLVAHLALIAPDEPITLNVGPARGVQWEQGKAFVFDDTHVHDARHSGWQGERYILHVMMCHPCEQRHLYPNLPSAACEFDDPLRAEVSRALQVEMDAREAAAKTAERMVIPRNAPQDV